MLKLLNQNVVYVEKTKIEFLLFKWNLFFTRGLILLNLSKCAYCKKMNKTIKPSQKGNLALKGYCATCNHSKSVPYTKA